MKSWRRLFSSISFRMLALYLFITIISLVSVLFTVSRVMEDSLLLSKVTTQQSMLSRTAVELATHVADNDIISVYDIMHASARENDMRLLVLDNNYIVKTDSASLYNGYYLPYDEAVKVISEKAKEAHGFHRLTNSLNQRVEWVAYYAQPLTSNGSYIGALVCSVSIQDAYTSLHAAQQRTTILFSIVVLAVMFACWLSTGLLTKPIIDLTNIIRKTTAKNYQEHINIRCTGEIKELVDAFNRMSSELISYDKSRNEFVSNASHELKTPLAAMKVLSESLITMDNPDPVYMLDFLKDIDHEVDRLNNIISDLLEITRSSSGTAKLNMEQIDLSDLAQKVSIRLKPLADTRNIELRFVSDDKVQIIADITRFDRVLTNLIDNAIKYTERGYVAVEVRSDGAQAKITVTDSGVGIPADAVSHVFDRFYRVDKARSRATGGTGLGLSLVKDLVESHGGTIIVTSTPGKGSIFTVTMPLS